MKRPSEQMRVGLYGGRNPSLLLVEALDAAGVEVAVWRPDEWDQIAATLVGRPDAVVAIGPCA